jgi:hypothetical protein
VCSCQRGRLCETSGASEHVRVKRTGRGYACANVIWCGCGMVLTDAAFFLIDAAFLRFALRVSGA